MATARSMANATETRSLVVTGEEESARSAMVILAAYVEVTGALRVGRAAAGPLWATALTGMLGRLLIHQGSVAKDFGVMIGEDVMAAMFREDGDRTLAFTHHVERVLELDKRPVHELKTKRSGGKRQPRTYRLQHLLSLAPEVFSELLRPSALDLRRQCWNWIHVV